MKKLLSLFLASSLPIAVLAQRLEPSENFASESPSSFGDTSNDDSKTPEQLTFEGAALLEDQRLLDGRSKLLKALEKDPSFYRAHAKLAEYYMTYVGHFRLSLKYVKRAMDLFFQQNGSPPFEDIFAKSEHAYLLSLLAQVRLNLDNYEGALQILDEFSSFGYFGVWYPGTRAWVLMKLGRIKEAIQVARLGLVTGGEEGRTLNMLGILLSMDNQPQSALQVFRQAVEYELSQGEYGQPATPLNNSGEVYKEQFDEDRAESSWRKATRLPDGCEHVLPALNLAILLMEQLRHREALSAITEFESCFSSNYPLKNEEEHRALVHLAKGRIDLTFGKVESAVQHFESALQGIQWFGKIGTSPLDLQAGAMTSLAQALEARAHHVSFMRHHSFLEWMNSLREQLMDSLKSR
jgi:Tfp pilus assembly protein PilF